MLEINIDEYTPAMKPTNREILNVRISLAPKIIRIITGIIVVIVVKIVLVRVLRILIFTRLSRSEDKVILFLYLLL